MGGAGRRLRGANDAPGVRASRAGAGTRRPRGRRYSPYPRPGSGGSRDAPAARAAGRVTAVAPAASAASAVAGDRLFAPHVEVARAGLISGIVRAGGEPALELIEIAHQRLERGTLLPDGA